MHLQEREHLQSDRTKSGVDLVSGEGGAARYAADGFRCRRIEDLAQKQWTIVTRVEHRNRRSPRDRIRRGQRSAKQSGKVTGPFSIGGQSGEARSGWVCWILLPGEKKKRFFMALFKTSEPYPPPLP